MMRVGDLKVSVANCITSDCLSRSYPQHSRWYPSGSCGETEIFVIRWCAWPERVDGTITAIGTLRAANARVHAECRVD